MSPAVARKLATTKNQRMTRPCKMEGAIGKTKVVIIVPIALLASSISWMAMRILLQRNRRTKRMMRVSTPTRMPRPSQVFLL